MDREQAARRTRAAQWLGGYRTVEQLAEALEGSGVGLKRLREIYQQRGNEPRRVELREIAEACGLPFEFFTADVATLGEAATGLDAHRDEMGRSIPERLLDIEDVIRSVEPRLALLEADRRKQREDQAPAGSTGKAGRGQSRRRRAGG